MRPARDVRAGIAIVVAFATVFGTGGCFRGKQSLENTSTTDGDLAVQNLNAQIDTAAKALARLPGQKQMLGTLITFLQTRGQFLGRIDDYEKAGELAETLVQVAPDDPASQLALAGTHSTFHEFERALADLGEAERRGAEHIAVLRSSASILQAQGRLDQAVRMWNSVIATDRGIISLGSAASAHGERGEFDEAERLFDQAIREYRDVSPFPVAWLEFQRGLMWQRAGELSRAEEYFHSAHRRLPSYVAPLDHLAEIRIAKGDRRGAIEILITLIALSTNPEYTGDLAEQLAKNGERAKADSLRIKAREGFEVLLKKHPAAFADHAAHFWLSENPPSVGEPSQSAFVCSSKPSDNPEPSSRKV